MAVLARRAGVEHLEAVEDAVQSALMTALETWQRSGVPDQPSAWLYRVAHNHLVGELRQASTRRRLLDQNAPTFESLDAAPDARFVGEMQDDLLRMLFVCAHDAIPGDSQLVLALKVLCGFSTREIALRLFTSESNVHKRLGRARERLRATPAVDGLSLQQYQARLEPVRKVLYLMFTEGYLSSHAEQVIVRELCDDAIRLATLLARHPLGRGPTSFALVALMHLHAARVHARQDGSGGLLLLEEQDRSLWDKSQIHMGLEWLARSAEGDEFSRYHAEAGIAAEHCLAPSFEETRWDRIVECYELLERVAPSALHRLNRAVAVAECEGPSAGLAVLGGFEPPTWLEGSHLWAAVLADLHRRAANASEAERYRSLALQLAPSEAIRVLLERRLGAGAVR